MYLYYEILAEYQFVSWHSGGCPILGAEEKCFLVLIYPLLMSIRKSQVIAIKSSLWK